MMLSSSVPAPSALNQLPELHLLEPRKQVLWTLAAAKQSGAGAFMTPVEISETLADPHGISISRQRVVAILDKERGVGTVRSIRRDGATCFQLMRLGEEELLGSSIQSVFVDPTKALSSIRNVEDVLRSLRGIIRVCDPYIDARTLDYLAQMEGATSIELLTENVQDSNRLKRDLTAFKKEHRIPLEIRVATPGQLHDRYVLHANGMLFVGASFKDIGKKQSMIVALPASFATELERNFSRNWSNATNFG
jgi:hypothetical protein